MKARKNGIKIYLCVISFLCFLSIFVCTRLFRDGHFEWDTHSTLVVVFLFFLAVTLSFLLTKFGKLSDCKNNIYIDAFLPKREKYFIWLAIFLMWLPSFLAYFPGICAYDVEGMFYQFLYGPFNNHHPIVYTLLLKYFYFEGIRLVNSTLVGVACISLLQMAFLSRSFANLVYLIAPIIKKRERVFLIAFLGIFPFNWYMALSITKDAFFAGAFLNLIIYISLLFESKKDNSGKKHVPQVFANSIIVILFRGNGKYIIFVMAVIGICFSLCRNKDLKIIRKISFALLLATLLGTLILTLLDRATEAQEVDKREMLSVPMQQIARVINLHYEELSDEVISDAETLIWPSALYSYNPYISDPVKSDFITWEILNNPIKWVKFYCKLFLKYPKDYVEAFLCLYSGYLNPYDESHLLINQRNGVVGDGYHYIQTIHLLDRFGVNLK